MSRPTRLIINKQALRHNLQRVRELVPGKEVLAMVKANAYGCGLDKVVPVLDEQVEAFGVACMEEAYQVRALGSQKEILLMQGVFSPQEYLLISQQGFTAIIHHQLQLDWLLSQALEIPIKVWVKVNTGMNRLGFKPESLSPVLKSLHNCPWVLPELGLMTHMASADEWDNPETERQIKLFLSLAKPGVHKTSMANSATLIRFPDLTAEMVRPGIMLYGVSPFADRKGLELGLIPVMRFLSALTAVHHLKKGEAVGYGGTWRASRDSIIGIVPVGYGDGYPRHIKANTPVGIRSHRLPIVGRVSMDMLAVDLTDCPSCQSGDEVELWGEQIAVEEIAAAAGTIPYELICQLSDRTRLKAVI